ncbi:MAG: PDZ domain-containing protein, partial [Crocinitomix sp.]|nr:PDZ domain-containing protein [Crocinitomix sp.]
MTEMEENEKINEEAKGTNYVFLIPILMGITLAVGVWLGTLFIPAGGGNTNVISSNSNKFSTILEMIEDRYVDSVDHDMLIESSIAGMIEKLDPHSVYIPASDLSMVNEELEGKFGGVGIRFLIHDDSLVATHIMPGSPSLAAGMQAGDRLIEVDGQDISKGDVTNEKVMELLKGREGSSVKIKVFRKGVIKDLTV